MTPKERAAMQQAIEFIVDCEYGKAELALREALAEQAEQEPVAWGVDWGKDGDQSCVSIIKKHSDGTCEVVAVEYSPNSVRTKDLTDQEIQKLRHKIDWTAEWSYVNFARSVIAADREKNK